MTLRRRKPLFAGLVTACLTVGVLLPAHPSAADPGDARGQTTSAEGTESSLGTPITEFLSHGVGYTTNSDGRSLGIFIARGLPSIASVVDINTGELLMSEAMPDVHQSWSYVTAPDRKVYIGTDTGGIGGTASIVYRFDPEAMQFERLTDAPSGQNHMFSTDITSDGATLVYGTYPDGKVLSYDIEADTWTDHGTVVAGNTYARSMDLYDDETLYVGTGSTAALARVDLTTNEVELIENPEGEEGQEFVYDLTIRGDLLFARYSPSNHMHILDLSTHEWVDAPDRRAAGLGVSPIFQRFGDANGPREVIIPLIGGGAMAYDIDTGAQTDVCFNSLNGRHWSEVPLNISGMSEDVLVMGTTRGAFSVYDPVSDECDLLESEPQPAGIRIRSVEVGSDGHLYAGGLGMGRVDLESGAIEDVPYSGQSQQLHRHGNYLISGTYTNAGISVYDLSQPLSEGTNPRPSIFIREGQDRTVAITSMDAEVAVGTFPTPGQLGGALAIVDPETLEMDVYQEPVEDQSVIALQYHDGLLYGGTGVSGGLGTPPTQTEGKLFIFDPVAGEVVFETVPVPGDGHVSGLTIDPDGDIWGVTRNAVFTFDTQTREVVTVKRYFDEDDSESYYLGRSIEWVDNKLVTVSNGVLFEVDPSTMEKTDLASGVNMLTVDRHGAYYYGRGPELFQWMPEREPDRADQLTLEAVELLESADHHDSIDPDLRDELITHLRELMRFEHGDDWGVVPDQPDAPAPVNPGDFLAVTNHSFEEPMIGDQIPGWTIRWGGDDVSMEVSSERSAEGTNSLLVSDQSGTAAAAIASDPIRINAEHRLQMTTSVFAESGRVNSTLYFLDKQGVRIDTAPINWAAPLGEWATRDYTTTPPAEATHVQLLFDSGGNNMAMSYFDNVRLRQLPEAGTETSLGVPIGDDVAIRSLEMGPDGQIYAGGDGLARVDAQTGESESLPRTGHMQQLHAHGDYVVAGTYSRAGIALYDTSEPLSEGINPRPNLYIGDGQDRTVAVTSVGERIAVGTGPTSGRLGGALALIDPETLDMEVHQAPVEDQSVLALEYHDGLIYGGTGITGGAGAAPTQADGKLFIFDPVAGEVVFETVPVPGDGHVSGLTIDPDGDIWGVTRNAVFTFDTQTRVVVGVERYFDNDDSATYYVGRNIEWVGDRIVAVTGGITSGTLFEVDPASMAKTDIEDSVTLITADDAGNLYYGRGPELFRWTPAPTPVEVAPDDVVFHDEPGTFNDSFVIPTVAGVEYLIEGEPVQPGSHAGAGVVTVGARVLDGYRLSEGATTMWSEVFHTAVTIEDIQAVAAQGIDDGRLTDPLASELIDLLEQIANDVPAHPAWVAGQAYTDGDVVSHDGKVYEAMWWTQEEPGTTVWGSWQEMATDEDGTAIWTASRVFDRGDVVVHRGETYVAKWWTRNEEPGDRWGPWVAHLP